MRPVRRIRLVQQLVAETREMGYWLGREELLPLSGNASLGPLLASLATEGQYLEPEALLRVWDSCHAAAQCRQRLLEAADLKRLYGYGESLHALKGLRQLFQQTLNRQGEILDTASWELEEIRRRIRQLRQRLNSKLEELLAQDSLRSYWQEHLVTQRNGRYVLPLKAEHKGRVRGFIHDVSGSGQTLYLEPAAALDLNNELQAQLRAQQQEEQRILQRLAAAVHQDAAKLKENQQLLTRLDLRQAAARLGQLYDGCFPKLSGRPELLLYGARHPLLLVQSDGRPRQGQVVPVDILLQEEEHLLVISGPNTGGKSVALKTAGLLLLMLRCGLPVPCAPGSRVHLFAYLLADIGDEQSIEADLSTFSGHLRRLRQILEQGRRGTLVLLDEAGTGTDPEEGSALIMAAMDQLQQQQAKVILTTHLQRIKAYGLQRQGCRSAAVALDEQTLEPTYKLYYGVPGASCAFTIARHQGFSETLLAEAQAYLDPQERAGLDLGQELLQRRQQLEDELQQARMDRQHALQQRQRRQELLQQLQEQKGHILEKARRRGQQVVRQAENELKRLQAQQKQQDQAGPKAEDRQSLRQLREDVSGLHQPQPVSGPVPQELQPGELVRLRAWDQQAQVVRVNGRQVEVQIGDKTMRLSKEQLVAYQPRRFARDSKPAKVTSSVQRDEFEPRLKLLGRRVDEALPLMERFLDDALCHGLHQVEIVHGAGEGALRQALRQRLAEHSAVSSFYGADPKAGGEGVTVVELGG